MEILEIRYANKLFYCSFNRIISRGVCLSMKHLPLTNSEFIVLIDDEDFEELSKFSWFLKKSSFCSYVARSFRVGKQVKTMRIHRQICGVENDLTVHHDNHDPLDNQRHNLIVCALAENIKFNQ